MLQIPSEKPACPLLCGTFTHHSGTDIHPGTTQRISSGQSLLRSYRAPSNCPFGATARCVQVGPVFSSLVELLNECRNAVPFPLTRSIILNYVAGRELPELHPQYHPLSWKSWLRRSWEGRAACKSNKHKKKRKSYKHNKDIQALENECPIQNTTCLLYTSRCV